MKCFEMGTLCLDMTSHQMHSVTMFRNIMLGAKLVHKWSGLVHSIGIIDFR